MMIAKRNQNIFQNCQVFNKRIFWKVRQETKKQSYKEFSHLGGDHLVSLYLHLVHKHRSKD